MSRRDNVEARCPRCRLFQRVCVCSIVPRLETHTRLVLLVHRDEERKPTNTGRLATLALPNSELVRHGDRGATTHVAWPEGSQPLLLFPEEGAHPISRYAGGPTTLIVPDGTWRQAAKMKKRIPALRDIPTVCLPEGGHPTAYRLRAERKEGGLATIEAIARAFGVLEGAQIEAALLELFQIMVERTLWVRGQLSADKVRGGIPDESALPT
ncbi:MAG: tRNA-uridine aminocarboxypropyltransferase [Polyangia bacterium]